MIWFERKLIAGHAEPGPARTGPGPWGLLQTLADGTKLLFKEGTCRPDRADPLVFELAPYLSVDPRLS